MQPHIHLVMDMLALALAFAAGAMVYRWQFRTALQDTASHVGPAYFAFLSVGSVTGAYLFGTLNLYLSDIHEVGRSIVGALAGAIAMVEIYKLGKGVRGSTGYIYVVPFCICVMVGRWGCFLTGLPDNTYGTPTSLPWAVDSGDGIARHPVQLYESAAMGAFLLMFIMQLALRPVAARRIGFYECVAFYAAQRFLWEFLKPYHTLFAGLNIFHFVCAALVAYGVFMIGKTLHAQPDIRAAA